MKDDALEDKVTCNKELERTSDRSLKLTSNNNEQPENVATKSLNESNENGLEPSPHAKQKKLTKMKATRAHNATKGKTDQECVKSFSSVYDPNKWELRVSTQQNLAKMGQQEDKAPPPATLPQRTSRTPEPIKTTQHAVLSAIELETPNPLPVASPGSTSSTEEDIMPGAFRMRPASTPRPAIEYDATDDFPPQQESRRSVAVSVKDDTLRDTDDDILIEATLVTEWSNPGSSESQIRNQTVIPEPELVTAHPMSKTFVDEPEDAKRQPDYKRVLFLVLGLLFLLLVVVGIALGVLLGKSKDEDKRSIVTATEPLTIESLPVETESAIQRDPSSPQARAFDWYRQDWQRHQTSMSLEAYFPQQRFALATFFYSLGGENWNDNEYWLDGTVDPCDWHTAFYGVICTTGQPRHRLRSLEQDSARHYYQRLSLFQNNLVGTLPPELGLLTKLDVVNLHGNNIEGQVPSEVGLWQDLTLLQLFNNSLTGSLPTEIGQLTRIRQLNFAFNQLTGNIPTQLSLLTKAEILSVSNNLVQGGIPSDLGLLSALEGLHLYSNPGLTGSLPSELGQLAQLLKLQLNDIPLVTGVLPSELGALKQIQEIQLQHTGIEGSIPSELGTLNQLTRLSLHSTGLTGSVPQEVCNLMRRSSGGVLHSLSVDCTKVKCSCRCQCVAAKTREEDTGEKGAELITDPPITVNIVSAVVPSNETVDLERNHNLQSGTSSGHGLAHSNSHGWS